MLLYFEFEDRRVKADVKWPKNTNDTIVVLVNDNRLAKYLPTDLNFEVDSANKVIFTIEDPANTRLIELQNVLCRRLQEFVNKS